MKKLSDYPDFAAASEKLAELKTARYEAETLLDALIVELNGSLAGAVKIDPITEQALAMLADDGTKPELQNPVIDSLRKRLLQARHQVAVHDAAIALQQRKVESLRSKHSVEICKAAEGEYRKLVKAAVAAAAELAKTYAAVQTFRNNLTDDGVVMELPEIPSHINAVGRWDDAGSRIHLAIDDATNAGFVNGEYKNRPQPAGPYDDIPRGHSVASLAAGPEGTRLVEISRGGKVKTKEWLSRSEKDQDKSEAAWIS